MDVKFPLTIIAPPPLFTEPNAYVLSNDEFTIVAFSPFTYMAPPDNVAFVFLNAADIVALCPST